MVDYTYVMKKLYCSAAPLVIILCGIVGVLTVSMLFFANFAQAQNPPTNIPTAGVELDGYAWSDTIGWISMNCKTGSVSGEDICGTSNYNVKLNNDGTVVGFAWSSNIGWIKFGGLSGWPIGGGTYAENSYTYGSFIATLIYKGWARACAGTISGDCSSMNSRTDGWDGWISLKGLASDVGATPYDVRLNDATGGTSNSYAWGGSVVGYVSFDLVTYLNTVVTSSLTSSPPGICYIAENASTCNNTLVWTSNNATAPYYFRKNTGGVVNISSAVSGNHFAQIPLGTTEYEIGHADGMLQTHSIVAECGSGTNWNGTLCLSNAVLTPDITLKSSRAIARTGDIVIIRWAISTADSCVLTGPGMTSPVTGTSFQNSGPLRSKSKFTLNCTGAFGTVSTSTQVEIIPVAKEV